LAPKASAHRPEDDYGGEWLRPWKEIGGKIVKNEIVIRRLVEAGALFLIGDGIMGLIKPRWHSRLWNFGPQLAIAVTEELAANPKMARVVYAAEAAIGIAIASCSTPENH
jgi:hypothetical protein